MSDQINLLHEMAKKDIKVPFLSEVVRVRAIKESPNLKNIEPVKTLNLKQLSDEVAGFQNRVHDLYIENIHLKEKIQDVINLLTNENN